MFKDRMLGSMRDSSASGVFRIRPASAAQGYRSGDRQWSCEGSSQGAGGSLPACSPLVTGSSRPVLGHSVPEVLVQLLYAVARTEASCPCSAPMSPARQPPLCYSRVGGETRCKAPRGNVGKKQPERMLRSSAGWGLLTALPSWLSLPTTSSRTSFQRMRLPVSCTKVTVILLWMP